MNDDLISREALKKYKFTTQIANGVELEDIEVVPLGVIDNAPTVEIPTELCKGCRFLKDCETCEEKLRPQGEWIRHIRSIECSVCKDKFFADDEEENCQDYEPCTDLRFNFCPNCGADMRGKKNETNN